MFNCQSCKWTCLWMTTKKRDVQKWHSYRWPWNFKVIATHKQTHFQSSSHIEDITKDPETKNARMFFSQDPMLLYPQSPYMQTGPAIPRSPSSRPSFLIDDLLVRRQSPYLVPKPPQDHGHEPQIPSSSGNSFNFGMPAIFSRSRKEHSTVYQGIH